MKGIGSVCFAAILAALTGCGSQNLVSVQVVSAVAFKAPSTAGAACDIDSTINVIDGTMDAGGTSPAYTFVQPFEIDNNQPVNSNEATYQLSTNDFQGRKVVVAYAGTSDSITSALSGFGTEIPASISVKAAGKAYVEVPLIPASVGQKIANAVGSNDTTILVNFHLEGVSGGGAAMSSGTFQFPVTICHGCVADAMTACTNAGGTPSGCFAGQFPVFCGK